MRITTKIEPSAPAVLKTCVLTLSLLAVQATVWYFTTRHDGSKYFDVTQPDLASRTGDDWRHNQRKLLELSNSSKLTATATATFLETSQANRNHAREKECSALRHLNSSEEKCQFIRSNGDCHMSDGFIEYLRFPYCSLPRCCAFAFVILALWLIFLFITVGTTADDYLCPSLNVISKTLGMSQNVAGVTFLAYGNGSPDIFSSLLAFTNSKSSYGDQLGIQALFGAGMFVTTVVVGVISFMQAFTLTKCPFLRDVLFYLGAVTWAFITLYNQQISLKESIGFIAFYVAYVLVVIVGHCIHQGRKQNLRKKAYQDLLSAVNSSDSSTSIEWPDQHNNSHQTRMKSAARKNVLQPHDVGFATENETHTISEALFRTESAAVFPVIHSIPQADSNHAGMDSPSGENTPLLGGEPRQSTWRKFLNGVEPIDRENWSRSNLLWKCFFICKAPAVLCLNLTVPVVDYSQQNHNWNKWLNVLHCVTVPVFCVMATKVGCHRIGGSFPVWALAFCAGLILAVIVAIATKTNQQPRGHFFFAFMAFVASVIWIYSTANEIVNLLQTFGIVSGLSSGVLGLTFLAWGNSIGDLVSDTAMARQGFPQMAVSACFGGQLLNMVLGIGLSCTVVTASQGHAIHLPHKYHQYIISAAFLATSLASSAIVIPLQGFRIPRMFGLYLIVLYIVYLVVSVTAEVEHL